MLDALTLDLRYALRALRRRPVLAATAMLTLAVGIAATTTVFSVLNTAIFKRVPGVTRAERLVEISRQAGGTTADVSMRVYQALAAEPEVVEQAVALSLESVSLAGDGEPTVRGALAVSGDYFGLFGVRAALGRTFAADESVYPRVAPVVVLSHDAWQHAFSGRPDVVGRVARINGTPVQVIGVLPPRFAGHQTALLVDVFLPMGLSIPGLAAPASLAHGDGSVEVLARLRPGVSRTLAAQRLAALAEAPARAAGESSARSSYALQVDAWGPLPAAVRGAVAAFLGVLLALVGLALMMACINVTTVQLARATERQREFAVRRALGAGDARLVRQQLTEAAVLFLIAGAAGVLAASWLTGLIRGVEPPVALPGRLGADFGLDLRVVVFSLVLTLGSAVAFSLLPALRAGRFPLGAALREGSATDAPGRLRLRAGLIAVQLMVTSVLLAATLACTRALLAMRSLEPGWNGDGVLVTPLDLQHNGTPEPLGQVRQRVMLERLSALPGVEAAALATKLPLGGRSSFGPAWVPELDLPADQPGLFASVNRVSPGYLRAMQIPLLAGRDFATSDDERAPRVAIINATLAARLWPSRVAIGRTFHVNRGDFQRDFMVVGVAADADLRSPGQAPSPFYYVPLAQAYNAAAVLHVRAAAGREAVVAAAVRDVIRELDPSLPVPPARPLDEALALFLLPQRLAAWIAGVMSAFGLLLAAIGVYGVSAFLVSRRAREVALRLALGGTPRSIAGLLVRRHGRAPLIGLLAGVVLAIGVSVATGRLLPGARSADPVVLLGVPLVLGLVASLAILAPVRRQLRRPLMALLRDE